jgi:hypothetical protein
MACPVRCPSNSAVRRGLQRAVSRRILIGRDSDMDRFFSRSSCWIAAVIALAAFSASAQVPAAAPAGGALAAYRQLRSVGLDAGRVYRVRDVIIDRQALHLVFNEGTIALTTAIDGRITGAFFEGDGEVLVSPSSRVERASLALFSGAAILEEKFDTAYLRFNDDTWKQFENGQRSPAEAQEFVARWNGTAQTLAEPDSLRLLRTWIDAPRANDRMLRARVGTVHFGPLDITYDALSWEPITIAQMSHGDAGTYYDVWTQFVPGSQNSDDSSLLQRTIQISKYRIDAHIEPPHDLAVDTELTLTSTRGGERLMSFELSRYLKLNSVSMIDGDRSTPLDFIQNEALEGSQLSRRGNDVVFVVLPRRLAANAGVRLKFTYAGPVMSEAGGGLMYVGARGTWYPNHGPAMADFDLQFRSPPEWVLLATGKRVQSTINNGEQVTHWVSEHPMPLAGFNLGRYDKASAKAGNVVVTAYATRAVENAFVTNRRPQTEPITIPNFGPPPRIAHHESVMTESPPLPPDPLIHARQVAEISAHTIDWLSPKLGEFPFSTLSLTQMPGVVSQGWPGLVFLSSYVFMAEEERTQRQLDPVGRLVYGKVMPIHETIHQWWGDEVGWRSYHDQWIVEAVSNYLALMTLEHERPEATRAMLDHYRAELLAKVHDEPVASAGPVTLGTRLTSSKFPSAYDAVCYGRGTWLIHMLREMLRDAAPSTRGAKSREPRDSDDLFFKALRSVVEQNRYKPIGNDELQKAFEAVLPASGQYEGRKSLDWFFDEWINGTAIPHFDLEDVKISLRNGRTVASGKIVEKDAPKTLVTSIPIYAAGLAGGKATFAGRVFADEESTSFHINVPAGTRKLLLDPNGTILTKP